MSRIISGKTLGKAKVWKVPASEESREELSRQDSYAEGASTLCSQMPSLKQLEAMRQQAQESGYQEGYAAGQARAEQEYSQKLAAVSAVLQELSQPLRDVDKTIKQQLLQLALAVARQIISAEVKENPQYLAHIIDRALRVLPVSRMKIFIRLNPEDATAVRPLLEKESAGEKIWSLIEDTSITPGGCVVFTENSSVDMSLDAQLSKMAAHFMAEGRRDD